METKLIKEEDFIQWLDAKALSWRSKKTYCQYFRKFDFNYFKRNPSYVYQFLQGYKNNVCRAFLKNLIKFMKTHPNIPEDYRSIVVNEELELPKVTGRRRKRISDCPTKDEVHKIAEDWYNERERLMILITFYGGLRECELVGDKEHPGIHPWDFNWRQWTSEPTKWGKLKVIGKNDEQRYVYMPPFLMRRIYQYIRNDCHSKDEKVFKIGITRWYILLNKMSTTSINRHVNPHLLRHACSDWLRNECGFDIEERKEYFGHKSISTTNGYGDSHKRNQLKAKFDAIG